MKRLTASTVFAFIFVFAETSLGDTVTETRFSTNSYSIPVFDVQLGTLTGVEVERKLLSNSVIASAGEHTHSYNGATPLSQDSFNHPYGHSITVPEVTGNDVALSEFSHSIAPIAWSHLHPLMPNALLAAGSHTHSVTEFVTSDFFSDADLLPFLGPAEFNIPLPDLYTSYSGLHRHTFFPSHQTTESSLDGDHRHAVDLDFEITVTFTFEAEPTPLPVLGDYNDDDSADAADYVYWRKLVGHLVDPCSGSDVNCNGFVEFDEDATWRQHYGETVITNESNGSSSNVPEPSSLVLMLAAGMILSGRRVTAIAS